MEIKPALTKLRKSKEFLDWNDKNKDIFLSYVFKLIENKKIDSWQFGFYHKNSDKITTFIVDDVINIQEDNEIFKKPDVPVLPIDLEKVQLNSEDILKITKEFQKKEYPRELISKTIAILQNIQKFGNIWNITYVMSSFNTLNIKINAENGKILQHKLESLMSFVKE